MLFFKNVVSHRFTTLNQQGGVESENGAVLRGQSQVLGAEGWGFPVLKGKRPSSQREHREGCPYLEPSTLAWLVPLVTGFSPRYSDLEGPDVRAVPRRRFREGQRFTQGHTAAHDHVRARTPVHRDSEPTCRPLLLQLSFL